MLWLLCGSRRHAAWRSLEPVRPKAAPLGAVTCSWRVALPTLAGPDCRHARRTEGRRSARGCGGRTA
eukprot:3122254-Prymnesium_polylepis.1